MKQTMLRNFTGTVTLKNGEVLIAGRGSAKSNPAKGKTEYVITSKDGMSPFSKTTTKAQAIKDARRAKKLGLDGRIIEYKRS